MRSTGCKSFQWSACLGQGREPPQRRADRHALAVEAVRLGLGDLDLDGDPSRRTRRRRRR